MESLTIRCSEFELIYNRMVENLRQSYELGGLADQFSENITDVTGYQVNDDRSSLPNLTSDITNHPGVVTYLRSFDKKINKSKRSVSSNRIYEFASKVNRRSYGEGETIVLPGIYSKVFFIYLGIESYDKFKQDTHKEGEFTAYYYSLKRRTVEDFEVKLAVVNHKVFVYLHGFHDFDKVTQLEGEMFQFSQCWLGRLKSNDFIIYLELHISDLGRSSSKLFEVNQLFGLVSGIGSEQNLLSAECVLLRKGTDSNITDIKRFINLRRNHYGIKITQDNLLQEKNLMFDFLDVDKLEHLSGKTFRLLTIRPDSSIIQSKLIISNDYSSQLCVPERKDALSCKFLTDNFTNGTLLMCTYTWKNTIYSMVAIDLRRIGKKNPMYKGAFTVAAADNGGYPFGNRMVMLEDVTKFDQLIVSQSEWPEVFNTPTLTMLLNELLTFSGRT